MAYSEVFGNARQKFLIERGAALWSLLKDHPRFAYYGTTVSLSDPQQDAAEMLISLARLQGQGMCFYFPKSRLAELQGQLEAAGMRTASSLFHRGGQEAYDASKKLLAERSLPSGLELVRLEANSSAELVEATVDLCQQVGLSTMPGEVMRGQILPGVCYVALNAEGQPVATASSYAMHAPKTPRDSEAFWGVLATHTDFRGLGLAGVLGARAIEYMWEKKGMRGFNTGIKSDNLASRAACAKLGVSDTDWATLFCFDDTVLSGAGE